MKNKHILVLSLSLFFVSSSQACQWVRSLISLVQSYVPFLKKNDIQATPEELLEEREKLKKIALTENNKVKRKILEQMHKRAAPSIQNGTRFLERYQLVDKDDVCQALIGGEYKRVFEDSFEAENDADRGQILSFFDIDDTQKSEMAKNPAHAYISIFAQFKDNNEAHECWVAHSHALLSCRKFCKEQLDKIGLGLKDGPSISFSIYELCMALYNFRHTDKTMAHTKRYENAHRDLAQAAFVCVNQSSFKDIVASELVELGVEKKILQEVGFHVNEKNTKKKVPAVYCMPV